MDQSRRVRKSHRKNARGGRRSRKMRGGANYPQIQGAINAAISSGAKSITLMEKTGKDPKTYTISWDESINMPLGAGGFIGKLLYSPKTKRLTIPEGSPFSGDFSYMTIGSKRIVTGSSALVYEEDEEDEDLPEPSARRSPSASPKAAASHASPKAAASHASPKAAASHASPKAAASHASPKAAASHASPKAAASHASPKASVQPTAKPNVIVNGEICKLLKENNIEENPIVLKNAYRTLARKLHPDKGGDPAKFNTLSGQYDRYENKDSLLNC